MFVPVSPSGTGYTLSASISSRAAPRAASASSVNLITVGRSKGPGSTRAASRSPADTALTPFPALGKGQASAPAGCPDWRRAGAIGYSGEVARDAVIGRAGRAHVPRHLAIQEFTVAAVCDICAKG